MRVSISATSPRAAPVSLPQRVEGYIQQPRGQFHSHPLHAFALQIRRAWLVRLACRIAVGIDPYFEAGRKALTARIPRVRLSRSDHCKHACAPAPLEASNLGINPSRLSGRGRANHNQVLSIVQRPFEGRTKALARSHLIVVPEEASQSTSRPHRRVHPCWYAISFKGVMQALGNRLIVLAVTDEASVTQGLYIHVSGSIYPPPGVCARSSDNLTTGGGGWCFRRRILLI